MDPSLEPPPDLGDPVPRDIRSSNQAPASRPPRRGLGRPARDPSFDRRFLVAGRRGPEGARGASRWGREESRRPTASTCRTRSFRAGAIVASGLPKDGIHAIDAPSILTIGQVDRSLKGRNKLLVSSDRVIGLRDRGPRARLPDPDPQLARGRQRHARRCARRRHVQPAVRRGRRVRSSHGDRRLGRRQHRPPRHDGDPPLRRERTPPELEPPHVRRATRACGGEPLEPASASARSRGLRPAAR